MFKALLTTILMMLTFGFAPMVFSAELNGFLFDKNGEPLSQTQILLKGTEGLASQGPVKSQKNGSYIFTGIEPGEYTVVIGEKDNVDIEIKPGWTRRDFRLKQ